MRLERGDGRSISFSPRHRIVVYVFVDPVQPIFCSLDRCRVNTVGFPAMEAYQTVEARLCFVVKEVSKRFKKTDSQLTNMNKISEE